jgi:hypothetical protein
MQTERKKKGEDKKEAGALQKCGVREMQGGEGVVTEKWKERA